MKVMDKIAQLNDLNGWTKERIISELYKNINCPSEIEEKHHLIGDARFKRHCNIGCGVTCLEEYLELKIVNKV